MRGRLRGRNELIAIDPKFSFVAFDQRHQITEHVVNVLGRLTAPAAPQSAETALQIVTPPLANTARYDGLRGQEVDHA